MDNYEKKNKEVLESVKKINSGIKEVLAELGNSNLPLANILNEAVWALNKQFPELAESEDGKIINAIIGILNNSNAIDINVPQERMLAWLEKQKEQKPRWEINNPPTTEWTKEMIDEKFEELVEEYHKQKPAEWSETKELVFKDICNHLEVEGYSGWVLLLNALRNGEFQPKAEWSEEDEEMRQGCIDSVEYELLDNGKDDEIKTDPRIIWLKSLRPQPKVEGSEENENTIESIKGLITMGRFADTNTIRTIWKLLDSLRPSWKPSEEQMKALRNFSTGLFVGDGDCDALRSLYEQLKKL